MFGLQTRGVQTLVHLQFFQAIAEVLNGVVLSLIILGAEQPADAVTDETPRLDNGRNVFTLHPVEPFIGNIVVYFYRDIVQNHVSNRVVLFVERHFKYRVTKVIERYAGASFKLVPTNNCGLRPLYDKHKSIDLR